MDTVQEKRPALSSINFKPVKNGSESHNFRRHKMEHIYQNLSINNSSWTETSVAKKRATLEKLCKEKTGKKMQSKATPIREAVVNLNANHNIEDLHLLATTLEKKYGIHCFQIFIHRDEGQSEDKLNYHGHMLFDWMNHDTGKSYKLNRIDMVKIQTTVAETLKMERGKEGSKAIRLEAQAYKITQEIKKLEKKKNSLEMEPQVLKILKLRIKTSRDNLKKAEKELEELNQIYAYNCQPLEDWKQRVADLKQRVANLKEELETVNEDTMVVFRGEEHFKEEVQTLKKRLNKAKLITKSLQKLLTALSEDIPKKMKELSQQSKSSSISTSKTSHDDGMAMQ